MNIILQKPIVSEKSMKLADRGWYTFIVNKSARKPIIARTIEEQFSVNVISVRTAQFKAESKRQRSFKGKFTVPGYKKALVQLKSGQKISLFDVEGDKSADKKSKAKVAVQEKTSLLKGTKVKIERTEKEGK